MKYFIIFLLGVALGSLATIISQPTFTCVLTNIPANTHRVKPSPVVETPVATLPPIKKSEEPPAPVVIKEEEKNPATNTAEVEARENISEVLPALDFTAINERPVFWPSSVKLLTNTVVSLFENNKKIAEVPLNAGDILQLSKVFGDGKIEVRAKNMKFEVDSKLTNFDSLVREKIKELAAQGNNTLAPYVRPGENYIPPAKPKLVAPVTPPSTSEKSVTPPDTEPETAESALEIKGRSLDDKMNALFTSGTFDTEKDKTKPKNNKK